VSTLEIQTPRWFLPLLAPARYKGVWGGRGSGKSHAMAEYIVERTMMTKTDVVCIREVQKSLSMSVKRLIEDKIENLGLIGYFDIQRDKIIHKSNGSMMIFAGMQSHTADSIKSLEGFDIAWVEEAQSLSQRSLDLLRPTIRKPNSEILFTWNPSLATDPVDSFLRSDTVYPGSVVVPANYMDNPWFPDVLRDEMEYDKRRDPDKYAHVWLGNYEQNSEARVFKNWSIEEFEVDPTQTIRQGADWGFSVDPTVLVQCYIVGRKLYVPYEAYRVGCEIVDTPELFMSLPDSEKWPMTADSARPETISHMRRNGFPKIMPAVKGPGSLEDGVQWLKSFDIVVHPRCKHLIDELTLYKYKTDPLTGIVMPVLDDKDNHVIDAVRYACEGARRAQIAAQRPNPYRLALCTPIVAAKYHKYYRWTR
jgi:phage terminase large subunit